VHQIELQVANVPFAARVRVVLGVGLLHGHIRQVNVWEDVDTERKKPPETQTNQNRADIRIVNQ
jgi:hypothetical protein